MTPFDISTFNVEKFDKILNTRGLCKGVGKRDGSMCIEAAICAVLDLPHNDDPQCVAESVRTYKITLNDSNWSSNEARAKGLRDLGLAQLGSKGVVDSVEFSKRLAEKTIRVLLPKLYREIAGGNLKLLEVADRCEKGGTRDAAYAATHAAAYAAAHAAPYAAPYAAAHAAAYAATYAAADAATGESKKAQEALQLKIILKYWKENNK